MAGIEGGADRGSFDATQERPADIPEELWDPQAMAPFGPKPVPEHRWVESKSVAARVFILSAGVIMNVLLTLGVSSGIFYVYGSPFRTTVIDSVIVGAPAAAAGLASGDRIVKVNGEAVRDWDDVVERIAPVTEGTVTLELERGTQHLSVTLKPEPTDIADPTTGAPRRVGRVGIAARDSLDRDISIGRSVALGASATWTMTTKVVDVLKGLFSGEVSAKNLGGPIQIAKVSVQAARHGAETLWSLIAFLSLNIAILNLVPIPVLDGGQILLVLAEAVKGSAFSPRTREALARFGVLAVLALILLVTFNDIRSSFAP